MTAKIYHPRAHSSRESESKQARRKQVDFSRDLDSDLYLNKLFVKMPHDPDTIFKALRLVPEFDGNPNVLTRFIKICDQLATQYLSNEPGSEFSNLCLINGILNKITGSAACTINSNGIPESWLGIRSSLINNFSDQRDETALYNDLSLATQGNRTPQEFYDHCQTLFSTIMTYVTLHETVPTTIQAKRDLYKKVTMQAYVRGLKEPLGSRIRCMRPSTIEKALEYVQEELNIIYLQHRNEPVNKTQLTPKVTLPSPPSFVPPPRLNNFPVPVPNWPAPVGQRSMMRPPPQPFKLPPPGQPQQAMRMPTNTQRMFGAPPPNYNPRSHVFRLPPRNNPPQFQTGPQPMSGVQRFTPRTLPHTQMLTGHDWSKSGNPPPSNYFKSREMNMNECMPYDDAYSYYNNYDSYQEPVYNYYVDDSTYTSDFTPDFTSDLNYYDLTDKVTGSEEFQPQPGSSHADQDFQEVSTLKKQR